MAKARRFRPILSVFVGFSLAVAALAGPPTVRALAAVRVLVDLARRVDLGEQQRTEIRAILAAHRGSLAGALDSERASRAELARLAHQPIVDAGALEAASARVATVDADFAVERARIASEVAAVLTPDQRATIAAFVEEIRPSIAAEIERQTAPKATLEGLDLNEAQRVAIREILASHRASLSALFDAEIEANSALGDAVRQPAVNEAAVRAAAESVSAVDARLARERAQVFSEIYGVLTPEQQAQAQEAATRIHDALAVRAQTLYDIAMRLV